MSSIVHTVKVYKSLIVSVSILLACVIGLFIGVAPVIRNTIGSVQELGPMREEVSTLQEKQQTLGALDEIRLQEALGVLLSAVPNEKSIPSLFSTVEGMAAASGVSVGDLVITTTGSIASSSAIKQSAEERSLGSGLVSFTLSVEGSMGQVQQFLAMSGSVRRLTRIKTFTLSMRDGDTARATLVMDAFWSPYPAVIGKVSQRIAALTPSQEEVIAKVGQMELLSSLQTTTSQNVDIPASPAKSDPFAP